jgi:transposase
MTYSTDFRRKVLCIKEQENLTTKEAAKRFGIGTANTQSVGQKSRTQAHPQQAGRQD